MRWQQIDTMTCSLARTLSVVGDRWTMLILRDVFSASAGLRRFSRIYSSHRIVSRTGCVSWYATEFFAVSRMKSIAVDSSIGSRRKDLTSIHRSRR